MPDRSSSLVKYLARLRNETCKALWEGMYRKNKLFATNTTCRHASNFRALSCQKNRVVPEW